MTVLLADLIRDQARTRPDATAYVSGDRRLSFAEVDERSSRVANVLLSLGVGPGDRVAVLAGNSPEFCELAFAVGKTDAVLVGLNWRLAAAELVAILADAEPAVVVVEPDLEHLLPANGAPRVHLGEEWEARLAGASAVDPRVPTGPEHAVFMLYSSGTTGMPKGVVITNANLVWSARMSAENYRMSAATVNIVVSPQFHIGAPAGG